MSDTSSYQIEHPPGHYASPYPDLDDVEQRSEQIFDRTKNPAAIDLDLTSQLELLEKLLPYYRDLDYGPEARPGYRYHTTNGMFCGADAAALACMLRYLRPTNVIEVGSGFSSAVMLDMADHHLPDTPSFVFIEPFPERLHSLVGDNPSGPVEIIPDFIHAVDPSVFDRLGPGDVLFIDSSHVARAGGDVNQIFFEVLPRLAPGVVIHVHDIFYPFEYPSHWVRSGRSWNESYVLRAFLMYNHQFETLLFLNQIRHSWNPWVAEHLPLFAEQEGGSFWMRKK